MLFSGQRYDLLVTDPPYGVSYAAKNEFLNAISRGNRIQEPIAGDHQTPEEMSTFWKEAFSAVRTHARPGADYYVTGPQGGDLLLLLLLALKDSGFPLHHMLIWAKNNHVLGRSDYKTISMSRSSMAGWKGLATSSMGAAVKPPYGKWINP